MASVRPFEEVVAYLKTEIPKPYTLLYDLTAIDERTRVRHNGYPVHDFTIVYHFLSFERNNFLRLKVGLKGELSNRSEYNFAVAKCELV